MNRAERERLAAAIVPLAEEAGRAIMRFYADGVEVTRKADRSPVTEADHAAEAIITPALRSLTPAIPVVAEEAMAAGDRPEIGTGPFWLVDPLDGTKEFLARNGEFTVNIALIEEGVPVLGVVHVPASGDTYLGAGPGAARMGRAGAALAPIAVRRPPADGLVVLSSRSHADQPALEAFLAPFEVRERRISGSSVKFCLIAAGEADLYPRLGPTMEWDTAAGHAVLSAAGGCVETMDGAPLRYGKPDFRNPQFKARGGLREG